MRTHNKYHQLKATLWRGDNKITTFKCELVSNEKEIEVAFGNPFDIEGFVYKTMERVDIKNGDSVQVEGHDKRRVQSSGDREAKRNDYNAYRGKPKMVKYFNLS